MQVSVVFLAIVGLVEMDGPRAHEAMSVLHRILREELLRDERVPGVRVLSCLTGAIIVVPDTANVEVFTAFMTAVGIRFASDGLAVRAGISHGEVEIVEDVDGTPNAVGVPVNIAARLAYAPVNASVLVHEPYADHFKAVLASTHWLHPRNRTKFDVTGKRNELFRCVAAPAGTIASLNESTLIASSAPPPWIHAVLIAYDLPNFSDGDLRELASRFRSVVQEVRRLRETGIIPQELMLSFSPGGDGAVMALPNLKPAFPLIIAEQLEGFLKVESSLKAPAASATARIGLHYGPVLLFKSAEGQVRPTGPELFAADALAGDEVARAHSSSIISGDVIEGASFGSASYQNDQFDEIAPLPRPDGVSIRRHVRRQATRFVDSQAPQSVPLPEPEPTETPEVISEEPEEPEGSPAPAVWPAASYARAVTEALRRYGQAATQFITSGLDGERNGNPDIVFSPNDDNDRVVCVEVRRTTTPTLDVPTLERILAHRQTIEAVNPGTIYALATDAKFEGRVLQMARDARLIEVPVFWDDPEALAIAIEFLSRSAAMPRAIHSNQASALAAIADRRSEVIAVSPLVPLTRHQIDGFVMLSGQEIDGQPANLLVRRPRTPLTMHERFAAMNYEKRSVSFSAQNNPPRSFINFDGKRYSEAEFMTPVETAIEYAERGEREFFQVMSSTRKLLKSVWDIMQRDASRASEWNVRWRDAAERFAALEERWGERTDRYWLR